MAYYNGSDLILKVAGKLAGHCSTHTITYNTETKDRAVKPGQTVGTGAGLWKTKGVTGKSVSISAEGYIYDGEADTGYQALLAAYNSGEPIAIEGLRRGASGVGDTPYVSGSFVITSLEESAPAQDDATYKVSLENSGAITIDTSVFGDTNNE